MILLDENIKRPQREQLSRRGIHFRHISSGIGRAGMTDREVITLLHRLPCPSFFSRDRDYFQRRLCHSNYGVFHLDIKDDQVANYVRRILKHPQLNTRAKRMGYVLSASPQRLAGWRLGQQAPVLMKW